MTFEDAIAYSRNVVAAKVALKLRKNLKASSVRLFDEVAHAGVRRAVRGSMSPTRWAAWCVNRA